MIVIIEVANLVGAIHRAGASTDAAIVDLGIETVLVVICLLYTSDAADE